MTVVSVSMIFMAGQAPSKLFLAPMYFLSILMAPSASLPLNLFLQRSFRSYHMLFWHLHPLLMSLKFHCSLGSYQHDKNSVSIWRQLLDFCPLQWWKRPWLPTQMVPTVEAETCKIMHDHFQTCIPELKMWHISDHCFTDTFFSSVKSIHGYTCFQLYAFEKFGLDVPFLMHC